MKTIIIHHLQEMWSTGLQSFGTSFEEELEKVVEHLENNHYDNVIVTNFEASFYLDDEQILLDQFAPTVYDYMYGWEKEDKEQNPQFEWAEGGNHSEYVMIDDWMKDLKGEVYLCGAFDGECIEDMEIALDHVGIEVKRLEDLIV